MLRTSLHLSTCIQLRMTKHPSRKVMNFRHLLGCDTIGKLADKVLAALPGIISSILSWILNRAKEVIGWLSQNLWALITGVGVLIYTYFMTKTRIR